MKDDGLVGTKHVAASDSEDERIGNLASSASNEHSHGFGLPHKKTFQIVSTPSRIRSSVLSYGLRTFTHLRRRSVRN